MTSSTSTAGQKRAGKVTQADYERLADFRFGLRTFLHFSETAAREAGLTPQQHQALLAIKGSERRGGMNVGELSRRLLLRPHSVVELVDRLVAAGHVERLADPVDTRKVLLGLTEGAEAVLKALSAAHLKELGSLAPMLGALLETLD